VAELTHFGGWVGIVSAAALAAIASARMAEKVRIPPGAIFLLAAAAVSDVFPSLATLSTRSVERVASVALAVILFDGGLRVGWRRFRESATPIVSLGLVGTFITSGLLALVAHYVLGFHWSTAGVLGAALAPTDPAIMFSVLGRKEIAGRSGTILEGESGANDPVGIALTLALVSAAAGGGSVGSAVGDFVSSLLIGLAIGIVAGIVVHPAPGHASGTLVHGLLAAGAEGGDEERPGIVHRLDRDTSGLLVVARSGEAHARLQALLHERALTREYLALVVGRPRSRRGTIEAPIGRDRRDRLRHSLDTDTPREAVTHFDVEELLPGHALLRVRLETGRTHQIRVHLAAIDLPVAGDPLYGRAGDVGLERQFLHATRLAFAHPFTGEPVDVTSPLPPDLAAALARARS